ncbi:MAG: hypothetical protein U1D35_13725 [Paracoccaceae bacterium]|nr:hypothetical protein [Paracoccaceae bacterium]
MARKNRRIDQAEPIIEDALAYFSQAPWNPGGLREINVIDQMYGYYAAEKATRSHDVVR